MKLLVYSSNAMLQTFNEGVIIMKSYIKREGSTKRGKEDLKKRDNIL